MGLAPNQADPKPKTNKRLEEDGAMMTEMHPCLESSENERLNALSSPCNDPNG